MKEKMVRMFSIGVIMIMIDTVLRDAGPSSKH
jgi:hypothetical protein